MSRHTKSKEFEVEKILNKKLIHNEWHYHVKWTGYPSDEATWERLENLANAPDAVEEYENSSSTDAVQNVIPEN